MWQYYYIYLPKHKNGACNTHWDFFFFSNFSGNNGIVFINFYADWCRFSNMLAPAWDEAADKVKNMYPEEGKVVIGKVDCDSESK